jgi:hypothetical protein
MTISTYFKPNIHQNGPEILGVKTYYSNNTFQVCITNTIYLEYEIF